MAYLVAEPIALTPTTTAAANYPITLSTLGLTLVDDDWLILSVMCAATSGTLAINGASTGWTEIAELDVGSGQRMARYKCKVASGTAADPQIDLSTGTGQWRGCIEQWRDADATDCVDSYAVSAGSNASSEASGALTPGTNNCAISYFSSARLSGSSPVLRFKSSEVVGRLIQAADDGSIFTSIALGTVQQTTAAATAKTVYADRTARVGTITVAIKNKTSGGLMSDCRAGVEKMAWMGTFGTAHESLGTTWGAPSTFVSWTGGTIGGITADTNAPTINNDTSGAGLPWGAFSSVSSNVNTAGAIVGGWIALPATIDLTSKFVFLEWFFTLMGTTVGAEGAFLALGDNASASTGNAVVYRLAPKSAVLLNVLNSSVIDPATATTFDAEGSINLATINKVGFFYHRVGIATTARTIQVRNLLAIANSILVGGNAGKPLDVRFLDPALNGWGFTGLCGRQGDAVLVKTPIQFGDGTFPTYVDSTATLLNTPAAYSLGTQPFWNAAANSLTVGVKGASGDTLNFIASALVAGPGAEQNFTVDAATSSGANVSLQGGVFGNWLWTGDTDFDPTGATYSGCDEVAWKGALVTNCTVTDTTSADAAASVDANTTITGTTIDGTGALYALELGASVTAVTLTNCTLTAGSTDKVHVLATTGTVTITISGTTSLVAGDVTSAGAMVDISAPVEYQSVTLSNYVTGSRIQVYDTTNGVELYNDIPAAAPQTLWTDSVAASTSGARDIRVRVAYVSGATAKSFIEAAIGTVAASGSGIALSYRVNQTDDDTYNSNAVDGSAVTGITIVEGSTDRVQIAIAGGSVSWAQIYAYQCYWLFDSVGITDDGAFIEAPDTANYILTGFKIKNTHASIPLLITGGYGVDSTGSVSALYDTTGTSIFPAPAHVVPYATGSGVTPSDVTDIATASATAAATAVWADSKALTVPKFLGLK